MKFVRIWFRAVPVPYNFITTRLEIESENGSYRVSADTHIGYKEYTDVVRIEVD